MDWSIINSTEYYTGEDEQVSKSLPEIMIGVSGFVGNLLVIVSIGRAKFMHKITSKILVSLAVADLVVSMNIVLFSSAVLDVGSSLQTESTFLGNLACKLFRDRILVWIPSTASVLHLVLVTYERYVAIVMPFRYEYQFKMHRVYIMIGLIWVFSIVLQVPYMISKDYDVTLGRCQKQPCGRQIYLQVFFIAINIFLIILPTISMLWSYWKILQCLYKDAKKLAMENVTGPARELNRARRKVVHTLLTVVIAFIILWFPEMIIDITRNFDCEVDFPSVLEKAFLMMTFSNSAVNPVIYVFKYKGFRKALQLAVCPFCRKGACNMEVVPASCRH